MDVILKVEKIQHRLIIYVWVNPPVDEDFFLLGSKPKPDFCWACECPTEALNFKNFVLHLIIIKRGIIAYGWFNLSPEKDFSLFVTASEPDFFWVGRFRTNYSSWGGSSRNCDSSWVGPAPEADSDWSDEDWDPLLDDDADR